MLYHNRYTHHNHQIYNPSIARKNSVISNQQIISNMNHMNRKMKSSNFIGFNSKKEIFHSKIIYPRSHITNPNLSKIFNTHKSSNIKNVLTSCNSNHLHKNLNKYKHSPYKLIKKKSITQVPKSQDKYTKYFINQNEVKMKQSSKKVINLQIEKSKNNLDLNQNISKHDLEEITSNLDNKSIQSYIGSVRTINNKIVHRKVIRITKNKSYNALNTLNSNNISKYPISAVFLNSSKKNINHKISNSEFNNDHYQNTQQLIKLGSVKTFITPTLKSQISNNLKNLKIDDTVTSIVFPNIHTNCTSSSTLNKISKINILEKKNFKMNNQFKNTLAGSKIIKIENLENYEINSSQKFSKNKDTSNGNFDDSKKSIYINGSLKSKEIEGMDQNLNGIDKKFEKNMFENDCVMEKDDKLKDLNCHDGKILSNNKSDQNDECENIPDQIDDNKEIGNSQDNLNIYEKNIEIYPIDNIINNKSPKSIDSNKSITNTQIDYNSFLQEISSTNDRISFSTPHNISIIERLSNQSMNNSFKIDLNLMKLNFN